jgi:tetratricopeptide (TPR) repeat protein
MRRQLPLQVALGLSLVFLSGCLQSPQDYVEVNELVSASALVPSSWHPGTGFVIDREERLFLTTCEVAQKGNVEVFFPVIAEGKALVVKTAWQERGKERKVKAKVLVLDSQRDLAVLRLDSVPEDVAELKLAKASPAKDAELHFLSAGDRSSRAWAHASSTVQKVERREVPVPGWRKVKNQMIELEAAGTLAKEVGGGALVNQANEVVGVIASADVQKGSLLATDVSEIVPVVAAAYRTFAMSAYDQKQYDAAVKYSDRALAVWPDDALGYNERGAAWSQKDQFQKAIADYSRCIEMEPRLPLAWRNRASSYNHLGKYKEAIADASKALAIMPTYASAYRVRIEAYGKLGMTKEADQDNVYLAAIQKEEGWKVTGQKGGDNRAWRERTGSGGSSSDGVPSGSGTFEAPGDQMVKDPHGSGSLVRRSDGYYYGEGGRRYIVIRNGGGLPQQ